jgi:riboflavin kinase/FMN adenylyltransferase
VNIFDFDKEIYNQPIRMEFHNFVRGDMKFASLDELKVQIARDKVEVEAFLVHS